MLTQKEISIYKNIDEKLTRTIEEIVIVATELEKGKKLKDIDNIFVSGWHILSVEFHNGYIHIYLEEYYMSGCNSKTLSLPETILYSENWKEDLVQIYKEEQEILAAQKKAEKMREARKKEQNEWREYNRLKAKYEE